MKNLFHHSPLGALEKKKKIWGPWARAQCAHWLRRPWGSSWNPCTRTATPLRRRHVALKAACTHFASVVFLVVAGLLLLLFAISAVLLGLDTLVELALSLADQVHVLVVVTHSSSSSSSSSQLVIRLVLQTDTDYTSASRPFLRESYWWGSGISIGRILSRGGAISEHSEEENCWPRNLQY